MVPKSFRLTQKDPFNVNIFSVLSPQGIENLPIIDCFLHLLHVVVAISSGRNSMNTNSRIILEINKPKFIPEKKKEEKTHMFCYDLHGIEYIPFLILEN